MLKTIQFIALFLLLLVTGLFWGTWFSLSQSIEDFSGAEFIHILYFFICMVVPFYHPVAIKNSL